MSVERCNGRYFLLALSSLALAACSSSNSTAAPAAQSAAPVVAAAAVTTAPLVTGLPDFTALVERYGPAVVNVGVTEKRSAAQGFNPFGRGSPIPRDEEEGEGEDEAQGEGSGFIVSPDGYILTNRHVVMDATKVVVKLTDRREYEAKIIGMDERTDVAVLKIEGSNLPTVRIGDADNLKPGQWVVAIGSPFGMENSVTAGIVSATARGLPSENLVPFIQTDVAVNPGNSGGPLFNLNGEVVGINSQIFSRSGGYQGLSFAIPINMANDVREQLVATGKVTRGRIGVGLDKMNAGFAETFGLDRPRGALVKEVLPGEPAEKAGIRVGDIILSVGGKPVDSEVTLPSMVAAIKPGTSTELEVWTDRKLRRVNVRVQEANEATAVRPANLQNSRGSPRDGGADAGEVLGLSVRPLTPQEKQQAGTDGSLVIEEVKGEARKSNIRSGDIILNVGATSVKNFAELQAAVAKARGKSVVMRVETPGTGPGSGVRFEQVPRE
jgi:serine protease Do